MSFTSLLFTSLYFPLLSFKKKKAIVFSVKRVEVVRYSKYTDSNGIEGTVSTYNVNIKLNK